MASIHNLVIEACKILDVETVPEVYVRQNPVPNVRRPVFSALVGHGIDVYSFVNQATYLHTGVHFRLWSYQSVLFV